MTQLECDVAVIGAGTAGLAAERHARETGARTLLIDKAFAGTTCATVGCMPSKLLIAAADAARSVSHAADFGIQAHADINGAAIFRRLRRERDRFVGGVKKMIAAIPEENRVTASASFDGARRLSLSDGRLVLARAIVIATGASPAVPGAFDVVKDRILTNETLFDLDDLPASVAVIGAGPLGLELGQALVLLGVRVEIFDRDNTIGGLRDGEVASVLHKLLEQDLPICLGTDPDIARDGGGVTVSWDGEKRRFDNLLVAAGRPANFDSLNLEAAALELDDRGVPIFDPQTLQCGSAPVFIAGDANGDRPVLHEASHEGSIAGQNAAAFPQVRSFKRHVPFALTFTRPEAAVIGTVPEPDDPGYAAGCASFADQGRARVEARGGGLCRIYADRQDGRISGASLCAPDGGHLAHLIAWGIEAGLTVADMLEMPLYHPTLEEGLKPALRSLCSEIEQQTDRSRGSDAPCA